MPWYLWVSLGLAVGAAGGVLLGAILAAAGIDSAKYDDGWLP